MHGSNAFSGGMSVRDALAELGRPVPTGPAEVSAALRRTGFAYWPVAAMAPDLNRLLGLRRLFGLRSPVNTVARLLDPADAPASVDGVFHPPYIALHLAVAARLGHPALLVLKGGGGEAERPPAKSVAVHLRREGEEVREMLLPALSDPLPRDLQPAAESAPSIRAVWRGEASTAPGGALITSTITGTITGTIALALLAMRRCESAEEADRQGRAIWDARHPE
jgi:anthranilate phosphoribosyltransferase